MVWFTSDLHFGHKNIISFCNRPFSNVEEMDETLIKSWNDRVQHGEDIYVLGDVSFRKPAETEVILGRLKGKKHLILGNHDKSMNAACRNMFASVQDFLTTDVEGQRIVMFHYAMRVWDRSHYGAYHLYGHSHGSLPDDPTSLSIDVGVDCHKGAPISFEEVKALMAEKTWGAKDHHGGRR